MGRFSHELAYVMPDERTVYMSDDGYNVGLFMFKADRAGDLSSGTLYAAQWQQQSNGATLQWIDLGHATDRQIHAASASGIAFDAMFSAATPEHGLCPKAYASINTSTGHECLAIKPGMELIASRLESRRVAAIKGATTEFNKLEGITYNPEKNVLYLSVSAVEGGMLEDPTNADLGGHRHIALQKNSCGVIYEVALENFKATAMQPLLAGVPSATTPHNSCDIDAIANPDNISYLTDRGVLIIGEDSGSGHQNDAIWAYDIASKTLTRILTSPYGSETTGIYYQHDLNGYDYIMATVQHPYGESDQNQSRSADDARAYTGYLGPIPLP
jgi:secreted PhoX family phosphatase